MIFGVKDTLKRKSINFGRLGKTWKLIRINEKRQKRFLAKVYSIEQFTKKKSKIKKKLHKAKSNTSFVKFSKIDF